MVPSTERPSLTSLKNPFGAKCIFCKSAMMTLDTIRPHHLACTPLPKHSNKMMKPVNAGGEISR